MPNQEKQEGESFSAFFTRTSFRTNQTWQMTLCTNPLATLLLSYLHQPECVPYTTVYRSVWCTVWLCPQINNSKLCTLRQITKGQLKAVKKLSMDWKLFVHEMYLVCVHKIYLFMRYPQVAGHLEDMTVSPCLDMATLSIGAYLWCVPLICNCH